MLTVTACPEVRRVAALVDRQHEASTIVNLGQRVPEREPRQFLLHEECLFPLLYEKKIEQQPERHTRQHEKHDPVRVLRVYQQARLTVGDDKPDSKRARQIVAVPGEYRRHADIDCNAHGEHPERRSLRAGHVGMKRKRREYGTRETTDGIHHRSAECVSHADSRQHARDCYHCGRFVECDMWICQRSRHQPRDEPENLDGNGEVACVFRRTLPEKLRFRRISKAAPLLEQSYSSCVQNACP
ncbi:hypothetical protein [Paraburkholderia domus]|uniref:hypothetical protein n=1 Tax=Paraburkholderia domus TaxID=2793075 RepID=UPI001B8C05DA